AAYMAGALITAFLAAKIGHASWYRLGQWKPELGEPKDEPLFPVAGLHSVFVAVYYWRKPEARQYATEVAEELSKVTWPSRKEVVNSTTVVLFYPLFATVFFALLDLFSTSVRDCGLRPDGPVLEVRDRQDLQLLTIDHAGSTRRGVRNGQEVVRH